MKQLLQVFFIILIIPAANAQLNDLELANKLIGQPQDSIEAILNRTGNEYTITKIERGKNKFPLYNIYIEGKYGGVKHWEINAEQSVHIKNLFSESTYLALGVSRITIKYVHSASGHLKDFKAYDKPEDTDEITYEKSMGKGLSHFKVFLKK